MKKTVSKRPGKFQKFISTDPDRYSEADLLQLLHELDVYRVELESQNEELATAMQKADQLAHRYEEMFQKYVELYDFSPLGYISLSESGIIQTINFSAARLLGKERSRLLNTSFDFFISAQSITGYNIFLAKVFEKKTQQSCEVILQVGGTEIITEISGILTGENEFCNITLVDITFRIKAENELRRAKEEAESANKLKSAILSTISHELRTPLNSIIGFSSILLQGRVGSLNEEQNKQLGMIQSSGRRLLSLINDLLDLSRIEAGRIKPVFEEFDIRETIEEVLKLVWPMAQDKSLTLKFPKKRIQKIKSDKKRVQQVLVNILNNAIKFTTEGSISVNYSREKDRLKIVIADTGIGINENDLEKIFQPFIQVDNTLTRAYQGSGLGLAVSRELINLLQGTITVESEPGKGSAFTISLPFKPDDLPPVM